MFAIANCILIVISLANLAGLVLGRAPSVREVTLALADSRRGLERLKTALTAAGLAQAYLVALIFPLKSFNYALGLAWAIFMLLSVLESVYTGRTMYFAIASGERHERFWLHDSRLYGWYQGIFNLATIGVCALLILPR